MEDAHFADFFDLDKREEHSLPQLITLKGLSQIFAVFVEVNGTFVHVDKAADYSALMHMVVLCLSVLSIGLSVCVVVGLPLFLPGVGVSCMKVKGIYILLPGPEWIPGQARPSSS